MDPRIPLLDMPTPGHPSRPSGGILFRRLKPGVPLDDPEHTVYMQGPAGITALDMRRASDMYDVFSCPFRITRPIEDCVTDYPYGMKVPMEIGECTPTTDPGEAKDWRDKQDSLRWMREHGYRQVEERRHPLTPAADTSRP